jgi:hypothetical protein
VSYIHQSAARSRGEDSFEIARREKMSVESLDAEPEIAGCSDTDALLSDQDQGSYEISIVIFNIHPC